MTDASVVLALNKLANSSLLCKYMAIFFAGYSTYIFAAALLYMIWKQREEWLYITVLAGIAGVFARYVVKTGILLFVHRARPFVSSTDIHSIVAALSSEYYQSFPSGHAIFFFALSTVVYFYHRHIGAFFLILATLMGIARVAVGMHYPTDIIAGAVLGVLTGWLFVYIDSRTTFMKDWLRVFRLK